LLSHVLPILAGMFLGWLLSASFGAHRKQVMREQELREAERAESDKAMARSRTQMQELLDRANEQAVVFQYFPDLIRQLFSATGQRSIGPVALNLIDQLFHPDQAAIFVARPSRRKLALAAGLNLPQTAKVGTEVEYGQGRIGYAAEAQVTLDENDLRHAPAADKDAKSGPTRRHLETSGLNGVRADVVSAIMDDRELLGVLAMAGARARQGQEKKLLAMVSDLTAVALIHSSRLRATEEAGSLDGLTGVHNRTYLFEHLHDELKVAEREATFLSILMLDIDHFQHYNRTNGHVLGDEVLKKLAQVLKSSVRDTDLVSRYAGEEFVIIYPGANKELAMRLGEKIRETVESFPFPERGQQPTGAITISGGVATYPEDSKKAENLIRCADQALFEAKAAVETRFFQESQTSCSRSVQEHRRVRSGRASVRAAEVSE
jgi:diguanylate cyclase (GGDEF)-like protein